MSEAWKVGEIRIPVLTPTRMMEPDIPTYVPMEYFVIERWSDYTMRHPTSGVSVSMELWDRHREEAIHILRTEGR